MEKNKIKKDITMSKPLVSVVIPSYNRARVLRRSIDSVLGQSYKNIECIVVDDNSNDNTEDIIKSYNDKRLKYVKLSKNLGACRARNVGIEKSKGEYIAFQDSDDEWLPNKLEKQIMFMRIADVNFCAFRRINGEKTERTPKEGFALPDGAALTKLLLYENFISTQTLLVKTNVLKRIKFDESLPRFQDWDLALRLSKEYAMSYCDEVLVNMYVQDDSITKNPKKGFEAIRILKDKYSNVVESDQKIKDAFLRKECVLGFMAGEDVKKQAKDYLSRHFDLKILARYLLSFVRRRNNG